jgi:hypothetical protein
MPNAEACLRRLQGSTLQLVPSMLRCHTGGVWCGWATVEGQPILPLPPTTAFELSAWSARAGGGFVILSRCVAFGSGHPGLPVGRC